MPSAGRGPVVVLITPIFGVTAGMKEFAHRMAGEGFVVLAPDMFWRTAPGPLGYEGADRDLAQKRYKAFDVGQGMEDLRHIIGWAREWPLASGGIGVVGVCFGGRYAFLAAAQLGVDAALSYHGTYIGAHVDQCPKIACRIGLHFGEDDPHAPMQEVENIKRAAAGNGKIEIHVYPKAGHGFMQHDRPSYIRECAESAYARGMDLLKTEIGRKEP